MEELTPKEIERILGKANKTDAKPADIQLMRQVLRDNPKLWDMAGSMVQQVINNIMDKKWTPLAAEYTQRELSDKRKGLYYEVAPMLEKMVIDAVLLAWLRWQEIERHYTIQHGESMTLAQGIYWEKRLSAAQGRYLRVVESLARIRKLARHDPALQVNIAQPGSQQANIAGDLVRPEKDKTNG